MKRRVLFLCTGNSARSQMAEALLRKQADAFFDAFSAGTAPEGVDIRAIEALRDYDLPHEGLRSKSIDEFKGQSFDFVITLCDKARQECANFPDSGETIAWNFSDPKAKKGLAPFKTTLSELNERIKMFVLVQTRAEEAAS